MIILWFLDLSPCNMSLREMATSLIVQYNELTLPLLNCIYTTLCSVVVKNCKQIRLRLANLRICNRCNFTPKNSVQICCASPCSIMFWFSSANVNKTSLQMQLITLLKLILLLCKLFGWRHLVCNSQFVPEIQILNGSYMTDKNHTV
jgi:hypothetical protein